MTNRNPIFGRRALSFGRGTAPGTGASGGAQSQERQEHEDDSGVSAFRHTMVLGHLSAAGATGMTWFELLQRMTGSQRDAQRGWHHGDVTGALSNLHKAGQIARLTERRIQPERILTPDTGLEVDVEGDSRGGRHGRASSVYVALEHVNGRPTVTYGARHTKRQQEIDALQVAKAELTAERDECLRIIQRELFPLQTEHARLAERLVDVMAAGQELRERLAGVEANHARTIETLDRFTEASTERERELQELRRDAEARAESWQQQTMHVQRTEAALRLQRWLTSLEEEEWRLLDRLMAGVERNKDGDPAMPIPLTLGAVRTIVQVMSRLQRKDIPEERQAQVSE